MKLHFPAMRVSHTIWSWEFLFWMNFSPGGCGGAALPQACLGEEKLPLKLRRDLGVWKGQVELGSLDRLPWGA